MLGNTAALFSSSNRRQRGAGAEDMGLCMFSWGHFPRSWKHNQNRECKKTVKGLTSFQHTAGPVLEPNSAGSGRALANGEAITSVT